MSATFDIAAILRTFSADQKNGLLCALLRERCSGPDSVIQLSEQDAFAVIQVDSDLLAQARDVTLDGSTEELRELQRLVETPEDSISFEEFMTESLPSAHQ